MIQLKDSVKCQMTGKVGVVYGIAKYVFGETQYYVLFEGKTEAEWVTCSRLRLTENIETNSPEQA